MSTTQNPVRNYVLISAPTDLADEVTSILEELRARLPVEAHAGLPSDFGRWARGELRRGLQRLKQAAQAQLAPKAEAAPEPPPAPKAEVASPPKAAEPKLVPQAPARKSPWADKDPEDLNDPEDEDEDEDQDVPPAPKPVPPAEKKEDFEGVTIPVGSVHPRGGYVHWRSRRHVLGEALDLGIPAEVVHHRDLLTERQKPSEMGFKRTEALIVLVKEAQARGEDPAPLWARWLPAAATACKPRKAA